MSANGPPQFWFLTQSTLVPLRNIAEYLRAFPAATYNDALSYAVREFPIFVGMPDSEDQIAQLIIQIRGQRPN